MNFNKKVKVIAVSLFMLFAFNVKSQPDLLYNSSLVTHNIPSTLSPGQIYPVSITLRNVGLNTWNMRDNYQLSLFSSADNVYQSDVWGVRNIFLPHQVSPQQTVTFNFDIAAPRERGTYNSRWSMAHNGEYFGEKASAIIQIFDGGSLPVYYSDVNNNAEYISQSIPTNMTAGQTYRVSVTMKNTGSTSWSPYADNQYKLGFISDLQDANKYITLNGLPVLLSQVINPGETVTFEFNVTAPSQSGSYYFQTMMLQNNSYFGQKSNGVWINVEGGGITTTAMNNSSYINQEIPNTMTAGREYKISITMMNSGSTAWTKDRYSLALIDAKMLPISFNPWDLGYVEVPETVYPGGVVRFEFNVKAPNTPNYFPLQFSLMESGRPFGIPTPVVNVQISESRY